jgi:pilus assembly protein CpaE
MLTDTESMETEMLLQALLVYGEKLHVLTSPTDMIPFDMITPDDIRALLKMARVNFDYKIMICRQRWLNGHKPLWNWPMSILR